MEKIIVESKILTVNNRSKIKPRWQDFNVEFSYREIRKSRFFLTLLFIKQYERVSRISTSENVEPISSPHVFSG